MKLAHYTVPVALALTGIVVLASGCGEEPASPDQAAPSAAAANASAGTDRYIVLFKQGKNGVATAPNALSTDMARLGGTVERSQAEIGVMQVRMTAGAAAELRKRSDIQAVAKDRKVQWLPPGEKIATDIHRFAGQADPHQAAFLSLQWNLRQIQADKAWDLSNQGKGVLVCILDSGVDPRQIDLTGKLNLDISTSFVATERADRDLNLHGTSMASLVAGNGIGMASVAPQASLCSVKVLDKTGSGTFGDVTAGIQYVGTAGRVDGLKHVEIANMSLGALLPADDPDVQALAAAMQRAVDFSTNHGVLFVASAGNEGANLNNTSLLVLPAQLNHVLSVGATGPINQKNFDHIALYSNVGKRGVDVFAPGGEFEFAANVVTDLILAACSPSTREPGFESCSDGRSYIFEAGTSPSAAQVSGQAAVIEAKLPGNQTPDELAACIEQTADLLPHPNRTSFGRINVKRSLTCPA
jgi:subtilisin family serine protease